MSDPFLYDAVTLRHFATIGRLSVLESVHRFRTPPRWTDAVHREIADNAGDSACDAVLANSWLGTPETPLDETELLAVMALRTSFARIGEPATKHLGEAQSIIMAKRLGASFVTDDRAAYEAARGPNQLGMGRVTHACWLLSEASVNGDLTPQEVAQAHLQIKAAGRTLLCSLPGYSCG